MRTLCALAVAASVLTALPLAHGGHDDDDRFGGIGSFRPVATFSVPGATSAEVTSRSFGSTFQTSPTPSATVTFNDESALAAAGLLAVADPQPEFVSIRGTKVAVTLQENNGIAIIDISNPAAPTLDELFSAGVIANGPADLFDDARISFTDTYPADKLVSVPEAGARVPDAIAWSADGSGRRCRRHPSWGRPSAGVC
jgi:LVIVD repeat